MGRARVDRVNDRTVIIADAWPGFGPVYRDVMIASVLAATFMGVALGVQSLWGLSLLQVLFPPVFVGTWSDWWHWLGANLTAGLLWASMSFLLGLLLWTVAWRLLSPWIIRRVTVDNACLLTETYVGALRFRRQQIELRRIRSVELKQSDSTGQMNSRCSNVCVTIEDDGVFPNVSVLNEITSSEDARLVVDQVAQWIRASRETDLKEAAS